MLEQHMTRLKEITVEKGLSFSDALNYFLDHIADDVQFTKQGQLLKPDEDQYAFYQALFTQIAEYFNAEIAATSAMFINVPQSHFVHGSFFLSNGALAMFYFFEEIQMGVSAVHPGKGVETNFFRLSTLLCTPSNPDIAIINPKWDDKAH